MWILSCHTAEGIRRVAQSLQFAGTARRCTRVVWPCVVRVLIEFQLHLATNQKLFRTHGDQHILSTTRSLTIVPLLRISLAAGPSRLRQPLALEPVSKSAHLVRGVLSQFKPAQFLVMPPGSSRYGLFGTLVRSPTLIRPVQTDMAISPTSRRWTLRICQGRRPNSFGRRLDAPRALGWRAPTQG